MNWIHKRKFAGALAGLVAACASCAPPLRLTTSGNTITVDVQTLGEYITSISRIRVSDLSKGRTIWEIQGEGSTPQISKFELSVGDNPALLKSVQAGRSYRILVPRGADTFRLEGGVDYLIEVWGAHGVSAHATFRFSS